MTPYLLVFIIVRPVAINSVIRPILGYLLVTRITYDFILIIIISIYLRNAWNHQPGI